MPETRAKPEAKGVDKVTSGFSGLDTMTGGGLPRGRITVISGDAGAGKTLFALQAMEHWLRPADNRGVFVSFEESPDNIRTNFASFDTGHGLFRSGRLSLVDARWRPADVNSGDFDLAGLLAAVEGVVGQSKSRFLVLDGIDALLSMLPDPRHARRELLRLQHWVEDLGLTTLVTMKDQELSGRVSAGRKLEDIAVYMADCVLHLERRNLQGVAYRTLLIQKYRGSAHIQNKVPYIISSKGIEVAPSEVESGGFKVYSQRLSMGIPSLDKMLGGGVYRGSITLLTGSPGTAKTTLAASFTAAACRRKEKVLYVCFDESPNEIVRNMLSVSIDLQPAIDGGKLLMEGLAARSAGPDQLAGRTRMLLDQFRPRYLVLDPVSAFTVTDDDDLGLNAVRFIAHECKHRGITVLLTSLLGDADQSREKSKAHISTLCDNWIHLSYVINAGERNRALTIVKSRGTGHSNQVRELLLDDHGPHLKEVYTEEGEVLMGAMRWQREEQARQARRQRRLEAEREQRKASRDITAIERQVEELQATLDERRNELEHFQAELLQSGDEEQGRRQALGGIRSPGKRGKRTGSGAGRKASGNREAE